MSGLKAMVERASREMVESMEKQVAVPPAVAGADRDGNGKRRVT